MAGLVDVFATDPTVAACLDAAVVGVRTLDVTLPEAARPLLTAALTSRSDAPVLLVTSTFREAEAATAMLGSLLSPDEVAYYPAWETLPHERLSPRSDTVGRRLTVLRRLLGNDPLPAPRVVVAPVRALLQPQVVGLGNLLPVHLVAGRDYDITEVARALVDAAYIRVDLVERRGEFCVRGGIIDVFPPTSEHPVRIDFFGDTIEEIRPFSVADQRSMDESLPEITASPCREMLITDAVKARAAQLAQRYANVEGTLGELFDRISQGHAVDGMEALAPVLVDGLELLVDVLPATTRILVSDPERIRARAHELVTTSEEFLNASWAAAAEGGKEPIDLGASAYRTHADVRSHALGRGQAWWSLSPFSSGDVEAVPGAPAGQGAGVQHLDQQGGDAAHHHAGEGAVDLPAGAVGAEEAHVPAVALDRVVAVAADQLADLQDDGLAKIGRTKIGGALSIRALAIRVLAVGAGFWSGGRRHGQDKIVAAAATQSLAAATAPQS